MGQDKIKIPNIAGISTDPNDNVLVGWDDTDGILKYFTIGTNLNYDHGTHTLSATGGGVSDHGLLSGLGDDDHTQYALLLGRSGGQTLYGGTGISDALTLQGTSNGGATANIINLGSDLRPTADGIRDLGYYDPLGTGSKRWRNVLLQGGALKFYNTSIMGDTWVGLQAPAAISTSYVWKMPPADSVGYVYSNGAGDLSITSITFPSHDGLANLEWSVADHIIDADIDPQTDNTYDLGHKDEGSGPATWKDIWFTGVIGDDNGNEVTAANLQSAYTHSITSGNPHSTQHDQLSGLADDDHSQYALLAGRAGGQTLIGGTAVTDPLNLQPTAFQSARITVESTSLATTNPKFQLTDESPLTGHAANLGSLAWDGSYVYLKWGVTDVDWGRLTYYEYDGSAGQWCLHLRNETGAAWSPKLYFYDTNSSPKFVSLRSPNTLTSDQEYTLPVDYPGVNGYVLSSTTVGVMSWVALPSSDHSLLSNLTWSTAGHTFDTDLDVGSYDIEAVEVRGEYGTFARLDSGDIIASFSNIVNTTGIEIIVSDEPLESGHGSAAGYIGSIGTSGSEGYIRYGVNNTDWGTILYSKYDGDLSRFIPNISDVKTSAGYVHIFPNVNALAGEVLGDDGGANSKLTYQKSSKWYAWEGYYLSCSPMNYDSTDYDDKYDDSGSTGNHFASTPKASLMYFASGEQLLDEELTGIDDVGVACVTRDDGMHNITNYTIYFSTADFANQAALEAWLDANAGGTNRCDYFVSKIFDAQGSQLSYVYNVDPNLAVVSGFTDPPTLDTIQTNWLEIELATGINLYGRIGSQDGVAFYEEVANGTASVIIYGPTSATATTHYHLPSAYPAGTGYALTSTTAGVMSWIDHGGLNGLGDDDHTQYLLNTGDEGTSTTEPAYHFTLSSTTNNATKSALKLRHYLSSGSIADGFGVSLDLYSGAGATADVLAGTLKSVRDSADNKYSLEIWNNNAGTQNQSAEVHYQGIWDFNDQSRARAYDSDGTTINNETKIGLDAENYDSQGEFDSATNYRFTATYTGYYQVNAVITLKRPPSGLTFACRIKKNGTTYCEANEYFEDIAGGSPDAWSVQISDVIYLAATDYIELYGDDYGTSGGGIADAYGTALVFMSVHKLS